MRKFYVISIFTLAIFASLFSGCEKESKVIYNFSVVSQYGCGFHAHDFDIQYSVGGSSIKDLDVSATADDAWVTNIDSSAPNLLRISVAENDGEQRSTIIRLNAPGMHEARITITQMAAPKSGTSHTLIFYFFGTSLSRYFDYNIDDASIAISNGSLGDGGRVLFLRQEDKTTGYIGELYLNEINGECEERRIADVIIDATRPLEETVAENIAFMAEMAPADSYGMVLAGHGQGWITREALNSGSSIFSIGQDPWMPNLGAEITRAFGENNVRVDIQQLATAIEHSNVDFDYLLFDACFMSNIESLYDLRHSADYIIASPCEIMGRGFPYHRTLPHLFAGNDLTTNMCNAAESYYIYYRDEYVGSSRCGSVAVVDCAEIEALAAATKDVVATAHEEYDSSTLQFYEGHSRHTFFDFGAWCKLVATDNDALARFEEQLARTVITKYTLPSFYSALGHSGTYPIDEEQYTGITTSAPCDTYPEYWRNTSWHGAVWE